MEHITEREALGELLDRQAISDCLLRYARGVDRVDEELIRSAYWEDAHDSHGAFNGGPEEFLAWFIPNQPEREVAQHFLMNQFVELRGDEADAETYFVSVAKKYGSGDIETVGGRYVDLFAKRQGEWRIQTRLVLLEWQCLGDASGMAQRLSRSHRGSRDLNDPCYSSPVSPRFEVRTSPV